jgi:hypothetical protein
MNIFKNTLIFIFAIFAAASIFYIAGAVVIMTIIGTIQPVSFGIIIWVGAIVSLASLGVVHLCKNL